MLPPNDGEALSFSWLVHVVFRGVHGPRGEMARPHFDDEAGSVKVAAFKTMS